LIHFAEDMPICMVGLDKNIGTLFGLIPYH